MCIYVTLTCTDNCLRKQRQRERRWCFIGAVNAYNSASESISVFTLMLRIIRKESFNSSFKHWHCVSLPNLDWELVPKNQDQIAKDSCPAQGFFLFKGNIFPCHCCLLWFRPSVPLKCLETILIVIDAI